MIGRSLSHYRIIDKLGEGGMGVVYRAEDTTLGRHVALKLLPGDLTKDPDRVARFRREARTASSLNHPYVCTVYEVGEAEGLYYIATELVDGGSLRELLSGGGLELVRLLRFATQIAEGLSKAHEAGIVHRDVKPENILVSRDGFAKLADFGLAKLLAGGDEDQATRTSVATLPGTVLGTARYMSPEQARGLAADHRSDIFSFGLVLYEMAVGRPAYGQSTALATIHAIIYDPLPAEPLAGCPADLVAVIRKATEKEPDERYQSAADLAVDLRRIQRGLDSGRADAPAQRRRHRGSVLAAALLGVILVAGGWGVATLFQLRRPTADVPAAAVASAPTRIAVLPFENLSRAPDDDWLSGAFSDSITFGLAPLESLVLIPRESIADLLREHDAREGAALSGSVIDSLARVLRVRYYVHGTYQRVGDEIRVVARLVDVASGIIRTQERVTDRSGNLMALQDELARRVAVSLQVVPALERRGTVALAAYRAVTEGRGLYGAGLFSEAAAKAEEATRLDGGYADAWALLGKARSRTAAPSVTVGVRVGDPLRDALAAARRAIELNPASYDGYIALALSYRELSQVDLWRAAALEAVRRNPRMAEGYALLADSYNGTVNWSCGRERDPARAEEHYRTALEIDPGALFVWGNRAWNLCVSGQGERALAVIDEARRLYPGGRPVLRQSGFVHISLGHLDEGEQLIRAAAPGNPSVFDRLFLAGVRLRRGDRSAAGALEEAIRLGGGYDYHLVGALFFLSAGEERPGLSHLEAAIGADGACTAYIDATRWPMVVAVRDRAPVQALLRKYGRAPR